MGFAIAPYVIRILKRLQKSGQPIRLCMSQTHLQHKRGVPSMGGIIILLPCIVSTLLFSDLTNSDVWIVLLTFTLYAMLGGVDDYLKLTRRSSKGIGPKSKLVFQYLVALIALTLIGWTSESFTWESFTSTHIFSKELINLGWVYAPFACTVIAGTSNAVNLTDGLDGLATLLIITASAFLGLVSFMISRGILSPEHATITAQNINNITVFCTALVGSALSFLWFNAYPAQVFMGDLGSLSMGASLGLVSVMLKCELTFAIAGALFVVETLSVIAQVLYFRATGGQRLFLMTPLHHHFERKNLNEPTITIRFWIIALVSLICALAVAIHTYN